MRVTLLRVDSRLIHGQVVEAWLPYTGVRSIVVVDDLTAGNPVLREVMSLAVPTGVEVSFTTVREFISGRGDGKPGKEGVLILCRDLKIAEKLVMGRKDIRNVNLGNIQSAPGKRMVGPTIFLDDEDLKIIDRLRKRGIQVEARAVPSDTDFIENV
ncbi:MAG: PTS mannose/fructose/sorbose transporter subunit IIB [Deltaproteobacteria bacterium]|nr:MAG: PTS mannose/fructose/sorbose transporter subunit IIB [Deltaproteobacteria bacterium]